MPTPPRRPLAWTVTYWILLCVAWAGYCYLGYSFARTQAGDSTALRWGYLLFFAYSVGLTRGLHREISRRGWLSLSPAVALARILTAIVVVGIVQALLVLIVQAGFAAPVAPLARPGAFFTLWLNAATFTGMLTIGYAAASVLHRNRASREHAQALERNLGSARLAALEAQMNPHFLFNALNSLRAMIAEDPVHAQDMVTRLANILRHSLTRQPRDTVPLSEELDIARDYLTLEGVRFEERLKTEFSIEPSVSQFRIPPLALQTLVENAVKHGIAQRPAGGTIRIAAVRVNARSWRLTVSNSGRLDHTPALPGTRLGLANVRERLRLVFGDLASLQLRQAGADDVEAVLEMPV